MSKKIPSKQEVRPAERKSRRATNITMLVFEIIGIIVSIHLIQLHYTGGQCGAESSIFQCSVVAASKYSAMFGIPIAFLGTLTYITCVILTILGMSPQKSRFHAHAPSYLLAISIWCIAYSVFLACLSAFVIKALCPFCLSLYVVNIILFICSFVWSKDVPEGRFAPLNEDIKLGVKMPAVWGCIGGLSILLVISYFVFANIKIGGAQPNNKPKIKMDLSDNPWKGNPNSIEVVEVSDPKCPWCSKAHDVIKEAEKTYGEKFHVYFVNYPLDQSCNEKMSKTIHPQACLGAYAGHCADKQGKFWDYLDLLFKRQSEAWDEKVLTTYAKELGLNEAEFRSCLSDPKTVAAIKQDIADCLKNDVSSTPTVFFNGKNLGGITSGVPAFIDNLEKSLSAPEETKKATSEVTPAPIK